MYFLVFMCAFKYYKKVPRVVVKTGSDNFTGDFISLPNRIMKVRVRVKR